MRFEIENTFGSKYWHDSDPRYTTEEEKEAAKTAAGDDYYEGTYGSECKLIAEKQGIYTLEYTIITVLRDSNGAPQINEQTGKYAYVVTKGTIPVYVISKASQTLVSAVNELSKTILQKSNTFPMINYNISKTNLDKWFLPSDDDTVGGKVGETTSVATMYRGRTYLVFDETHDYTSSIDSSTKAIYTGIKDLDLGSDTLLDFTKLSNAYFSAPHSAVKVCENLTVEGTATGSSVPFTRTFKGYGFQDIILSGEKGIALLKNVHRFVVGRYADNKEGNSVQQGEWEANNLIDTNGDGMGETLDFSSTNIDEITFKNLELTKATEAIKLRPSNSLIDLTKSYDREKEGYLKKVAFNNVTYPNGVILDGTFAWDSKQPKLINELEFADYRTNKLALCNFNNLAGLTFKKAANGSGAVGVTDKSADWADYASSEFRIDTVSAPDKNKPVALDLNGATLYFRTITLADTKFEKLDFSNIKSALFVSLDGVTCCTEAGNPTDLTISGDSFITVKLKNVTASNATIRNGAVRSLQEMKKSLTIEGGTFTKLEIGAVGDGLADGNNLTGFETVDANGAKIKGTVVIDGREKTSGSVEGVSALDKITFRNITADNSAITFTVKNVQNYSSLILDNIPNLKILEIESGNETSSVVTVNGCGAGVEGLLINSSKINTINFSKSKDAAGNAVLTLLTGNKVDKTKLSLKATNINIIEGVTAGDYTIDAVDNLVIGSTAAETGITFGTLNLAGSKIKKLTLNGSTATDEAPVTISTINLTGIDSLEDITVTNEKSVSGETVTANRINVKNFILNNAQMITDTALRSAVKAVSGENSKLSATGAKVRITDTESPNTLSLTGGLTGKTITPVNIKTEEKEVERSWFVELLATNDTNSSLQHAAHSIKCYDLFQQSEVKSGTLITCSQACKNYEIDGLKIHYHAPNNTFVLMDSFVERDTKIQDAATGKNIMIQSGTTKAIAAIDKTKVYYKPGEITGSYTENGVNMYTFEYSTGVTIEHVGAALGINSSHDESKIDDGCILKVTYPDAGGTMQTCYLQTSSIDTTGNMDTKISTASYKKDANHAAGTDAPFINREEGTADYIVNLSDSTSGESVTLRYSNIGADLKSNEIGDILKNWGFYEPAQDGQMTAASSGVKKETKNELVTTTIKGTPYSEQNPADDRCKTIDLSNMRLYDSNKNALDNASLYFALTKTTKLVASNCDLLTATVSVKCQALSYLDMSYNRFGAHNDSTNTGWVQIGNNKYNSQMRGGKYNDYKELDCPHGGTHGKPVYKTDDNGNLVWDEDGNKILISGTYHTKYDDEGEESRYLCTEDHSNHNDNCYRTLRDDNDYNDIYDHQISPNIDATGLARKAVAVDWSRWGGWDEEDEDKEAMPILERGTLNLYGNFIFLGAEMSVRKALRYNDFYVKLGAISEDISNVRFIRGVHYKEGCPPWSQNSTLWIDIAVINGTHTKNGGGISGNSCDGTTVDDTLNMNTNFKSRINNEPKGKVLHVVANALRSQHYQHTFTMAVFPFGENGTYLSNMFPTNSWGRFWDTSTYRNSKGVTDWRWEKQEKTMAINSR